MDACPMCGMCNTVDNTQGQFERCNDCGYSVKRLVVGWD